MSYNSSLLPGIGFEALHNVLCRGDRWLCLRINSNRPRICLRSYYLCGTDPGSRSEMS